MSFERFGLWQTMAAEIGKKRTDYMDFGDVVDYHVRDKRRRFVVIGESSRAPGRLVLADRNCIGMPCHPSNCKATGGDRLILARQLRKRYEGRFPGMLKDLEAKDGRG